MNIAITTSHKRGFRKRVCQHLAFHPTLWAFSPPSSHFMIDFNILSGFLQALFLEQGMQKAPRRVSAERFLMVKLQDIVERGSVCFHIYFKKILQNF
ncbi:MAG: hypothetical protein NC246_06525 [Muribaculaceae bacterium]|nr:hypothetical protein [Muribaculaceae bacterium]